METRLPNSVEIGIRPGSVGSIVIVGDGFNPVMFDYRALFGGKVDPSSLFLAGPLCRCAYSDGQYSFEVTPNRIDLRTHGINEPLTESLIDSANPVINSLEQYSAICRLSSVGLNHDSLISIEEGSTGANLCRELFQEGVLEHISGKPLLDTIAHATMKWSKFGIDYTIRIEPEVASNGQNAFIAINGSNTITDQNPIESVLEKTSIFQQEVRTIHERVLNPSS